MSTKESKINRDENRLLLPLVVALARSVGNKAKTRLDDGNEVIIQEREDLILRLWLINENNVVLVDVVKNRADMIEYLSDAKLDMHEHRWEIM